MLVVFCCRYSKKALMKNLIFLLNIFFSLQTFAEELNLPFAQDQAGAPEILMDHYAVGRASEYPAFQTYGVGPCIAVTIYDPRLKQGAMMHVSASTKVYEAIALIMSELTQRGSVTSQLKAQLLGGWGDSMDNTGMHFESSRMVNELVNALSAYQTQIIYNVTVTEKADVQRGRPPMLNLEFDLSTGRVYFYQESIRFQGVSPARPMPAGFLMSHPL